MDECTGEGRGIEILVQTNEIKKARPRVGSISRPAVTEEDLVECFVSRPPAPPVPGEGVARGGRCARASRGCRIGARHGRAFGLCCCTAPGSAVSGGLREAERKISLVCIRATTRLSQNFTR